MEFLNYIAKKSSKDFFFLSGRLLHVTFTCKFNVTGLKLAINYLTLNKLERGINVYSDRNLLHV